MKQIIINIYSYDEIIAMDNKDPWFGPYIAHNQSSQAPLGRVNFLEGKLVWLDNNVVMGDPETYVYSKAKEYTNVWQG